MEKFERQTRERAESRDGREGVRENRGPHEGRRGGLSIGHHQGCALWKVLSPSPHAPLLPSHPLTSPRDKGADIRIKLNSVSRQHAMITVQHGQVPVLSLASLTPPSSVLLEASLKDKPHPSQWSGDLPRDAPPEQRRDLHRGEEVHLRDR